VINNKESLDWFLGAEFNLHHYQLMLSNRLDDKILINVLLSEKVNIYTAYQLVK